MEKRRERGGRKEEKTPASVTVESGSLLDVQPTIRMIGGITLPFEPVLHLDSLKRKVVYPDTLLWTSSSVNERRLIAENEVAGTDSTVLELPSSDGYRKASVMDVAKEKWLIDLTWTMGDEMAMSQPMLMEGNGHIDSDFPEIDGPEDPALPDATSFETWQDYYRYLIQLDPNGLTDEEKAMLEIAKHNKGKIVEHEHHYQPITLGLSLSKNVGQAWRVGSGLKYSLLRSDFRVGEQGFAVHKKQRIHYLGIPLYASYRCVDAKRWTVYASVGVELHVPLYGSLEECYFMGGERSYEVDKKVHAPVQWRMGANVGVQYKFTPHWGLYVEPSLHWQVPNGGAIRTSWTKDPWALSVPLGIRCTW